MELHSKAILAVLIAASAAVAAPARAQTASAICKDGTTSTNTGKGTCSGHRGVNKRATRCADGTVSKSKGQGACSGHGGVKAPTPRASATAREHASPNSAVLNSDSRENKNPKGAIAKCKDGLYSHAAERAGACTGHGGVARWM